MILGLLSFCIEEATVIPANAVIIPAILCADNYAFRCVNTVTECACHVIPYGRSFAFSLFLHRVSTFALMSQTDQSASKKAPGVWISSREKHHSTVWKCSRVIRFSQFSSSFFSNTSFLTSSFSRREVGKVSFRKIM